MRNAHNLSGTPNRALYTQGEPQCLWFSDIGTRSLTSACTCTMYLIQSPGYKVHLVEQLWIIERDHLSMFGHLRQVVTVTHGVWLVGVVLQAPHHGDNVLLLEHDVEQRSFVDKEQRAEYVVQVVKAGGVLKVLTGVEELEEFGDVVVPLDGLRKALAVLWRRDGCRNHVKDLSEFAQFAEREFDDDAIVEARVRHVCVLLLCHRD